MQIPVGITAKGEMSFAVKIRNLEHRAHVPFLSDEKQIVLRIDDEGSYKPSGGTEADKRVSFRFSKDTINFPYTSRQMHAKTNIISMRPTTLEDGSMSLTSLLPLSKLKIAHSLESEFDEPGPAGEPAPVEPPTPAQPAIASEGRDHINQLNFWLTSMRKQGHEVELCVGMDDELVHGHIVVKEEL
jgi:hypothetical protein